MASADGPGRHPDADDLALLAIEPRGPHAPGLDAHVAGCAACTAEVSDLRAVVAAARSDVRRLPPPSVWEGIQAATGVRAAPDPAAVRGSLGPPPQRSPAGPAPLPRGSIRRWSSATLAAAAVAGLVAGGVAGGALAAAVTAALTEPSAADPGIGEPAFVTVLEPLTAADAAASGSAEVVAARSDAASSSVGGGQRVVVSTTGLAAQPGHAYEVWLLDPATGGLLALGHLNARGGSPSGGYLLPADVDLDAYRVLDISAEPLDGDAGHSGTSELRGELRAVTDAA